MRILRSWLFDRQPSSPSSAGAPRRGGGRFFGGNLWKQLADRRNFLRLIDSGIGLNGWRARYFHNFAKVPEALWLSIFADRSCVSRATAWEVFNRTLDASPATDPADKVMHWDMETYLPGLFHQDDRMSMAVSLESRVPFADPRMVELAFNSRFDLKFRGGASKWMLRQAVADVVPPEILSRRKVGFDTPAETWMKTRHADFVRDTLLSRRARERGLLSAAGIEALLPRTDHPLWFDAIWKALCIETWATVFLDHPAPAHAGWSGAEPKAPALSPAG